MKDLKTRRFVGGIAAALFALTACSGDAAAPPQASGSGAGAPAATTPEIPQARWDMKTHPSGNLGKIGKRQAKRVRAQRRPVRKVVAEIYDSLFLDPARRDAVLKTRFHPRAARAIADKAGVPEGATEVRTITRKADIGIEARRARHAAAVIKVRAKGIAGRRQFDLVHKATLWLERAKGKWKVIAFEVQQRPAR